MQTDFMTTPLFDTRQADENLKNAGCDPRLAKAIVLTIEEAVTGGVSTKADITSVKADIAELRTELKGDIAELRTELKGDITDLRTELKGDIAELRTELKGDIADLRTELKGDIYELRTELKGDNANLRTELKDDIAVLRTELKDDIAEVKIDIASVSGVIQAKGNQIILAMVAVAGVVVAAIKLI
ncbi:MAG: DUF1640 domain-containing protein [Gammaproteobacteria bacterium]|nr:DUF1640 domain-containing protein [Gammaproteobacteria bacterium]